MVEDTPRTPVAATLRPNAIGFVDALAIGLNATSPAYSLAAVIGPIVALVGVHAPGVMLASFVPMVLIASAFYYLNRADPDCGTTFSWVTRALGPTTGWLGGWAITMTGVLVVGSLADVAVNFGLLAVGLDGWAGNTLIRQALTVLVIVTMAALCVRDTQAAARLQNVLVLLQTVCLFVFAAVALYRVYAGTGSPGALRPSLDWLDPFGSGSTALTGGLLLGVFVYWGWESAVNLTEETKDLLRPGSGRHLVDRRPPGHLCVRGLRGGRVRRHRLPHGARRRRGGRLRLSGPGGPRRLGLDRPARRRHLGARLDPDDDHPGLPYRAVHGAQARPPPPVRSDPRPVPHPGCRHLVGRGHGHRLVPVHPSGQRERARRLADGPLLLIAFYYALTGIACAVYHRRLLTSGVRAFLFIGAGPLVGAGMLIWLLVEAVVDMADPANSSGGSSWFGLGPPLVIALGLSLVGLLVMLARRAASGTFWAERPSIHAAQGTEHVVSSASERTAEPAARG